MITFQEVDDTSVDAYRSLEVFASKSESWPDFIFKFRIYLNAKKLHYVIEDSSTSGTVATTKRNEDDFKVQSLLLNKISSEALGLIRHCTTAKEMIDTLQAQFSATSTASVLYHLDRLLDMKYDGNAASYLSSVNRVVKQIEDAGGIDLKKLHVIVLLRGMPKTPEWLSVVNPLMNEKDELSKERVARIITENENGLQRKGDISSIGKKEKPGAFQTSSDKKGREKFQVPTCSNCGRKGHSIKTCWQPGGGAESKRRPNDGKGKSANFLFTIEQKKILAAKREHSLKPCFMKDSGAAKHYVNDANYLHNFKKINSSLIVADGNTVKIEGVGSLKATCYARNGQRNEVTLNNVFYVPSLVANLISTSELDSKGLREVTYGGVSRFFKDRTEVMSAVNVGGKWIMDWEVIPVKGAMLTIGDDIWHKRLCHLSDENMQKLEEMVDGYTHTKHSPGKCDICARSNITRKTFKSTGNPRARNPMDILHFDIKVINIKGNNDELVALIITDDCTNCRFSFPLEDRSGETILTTFLSWLPWAERMSGHKLKCIRSDNAKEFVQGIFGTTMEKMGVEMQTTTKYEHEQNGKAERSNRVLLEKARAILIESGLDRKYWPYALQTATYAANRSPTTINSNKTPIESFTQIKPNIGNLRVFGCKCWARKPRENYRGKHSFDERGIACVFLTYDKGGHAYKVMNPRTGEIFTAVNVRFDETQMAMVKQSESEPNSHGYDDVLSDMSTESEGEAIVEIPSTPEIKESLMKPPQLKYKEKQEATSDQSPTRRRSTQRRGGGRKTIDILDLVHFAALTYSEARMNEKEFPFYQQAMDDEIRNMKHYKVWEVVNQIPYGKNVIGCKWVLTRKINPDGTPGKYKARLVAKGYNQVEGIDYFETYAPTIKPAAVRLMLVIANQYQMKLHQFDVKAAYLNGILDEELYMEQPEGYEEISSDGSARYLKLKKALYGTKQAARVWRKTLTTFLMDNDFRECLFDKCIFYKGNFEDKSIIAIILWVDDILVIYFDDVILQQFKETLFKTFNTEDLGQVERYVGINMKRNIKARVLVLSQAVTMRKILEHFSMVDVKGRDTPLDTKQVIKACKDDEATDKPFRSLIGCLNYPAQWTRPDLAYAVGKLSQSFSHATDEHWKIAMRVLRYVSKTANMGLVFNGSDNLKVEVMADSEWGSDNDTALSTFGYVIYVGGNPVSWKSKRSRSVKTSTTTAELEGLYHSVLEAMWITDLLSMFKIKPNGPINCFQDNKAVVKILNGEYNVERTKHEIVKVEFLREKVREGIISVSWIKTDDMTADIFTKGLGRIKHERHSRNLKLVDMEPTEKKTRGSVELDS